MDPLVRWLIGMSVSLVLGATTVGFSVYWMRKGLHISKPKQPGRVPAWLTGLIERLFFTVVVAFNVSTTPVAMIGWLTVKMVTNWNRPGRNVDDIPLAFTALLAGLISMLFAFIGGSICSGMIPL